jgi:hypothetical protein
VVSRNPHIGTAIPAAKPSMGDLIESRERMSRAGAQFLKIDLHTALTFAKIALETNDAARRSRNIRSARKAYDTVIKLSRKIDLPPDDAKAINKVVEELRTKLAELGEAF